MFMPFVNLPPAAVLNAVAFALFMGMSLLFVLSLTSYKGGHKPADVDVLFPTPLSPKIVLLFRMFRDSLINLLVPLILMLVTWRPASGAWATLIKNLDPAAANLSLRLTSLSYFMMAAGWVALGYALSLYVNRPGLFYDRLRIAMGWLLGVFALGTIGAVSVLLRQNMEGAGILATLNNPILRAVFFLPNAAVDFSLAPITGDWGRGVQGLLILVGFTVLCVAVSLRQAGWLYEIAAQRVSTTVQNANFAKKGDTIGLMAEYARAGRLKTRRLTWLSNLKLTGAWALVWKDAITNTRGFTVLFLLFPLLGMAIIGLISYAGSTGKRDPSEGFITTFMIGMMVFTSTATAAQSGFIDMLQRVDTLKPLPYSPSRTMFFEVLGKALPGVGTSIVMGLLGAAINPMFWQHSLAAGIIGIAGAALISACVGLSTVMFPDVEDPSQRSFRGLVQLLVLAVFALPPAALYVGLIAGLKWSPLVAAIPSFALAVGLAIGAAAIAGHLFSSFNPNE